MNPAENSARQKLEDAVIAVTANFTAEPIGDILRFWAARLGLGSVRVEFSGYNQVFQELTAPDSVLASSKPGVNLILIRLEDWARDQDEHLRARTITAAVREFIGHFDAFAHRARRPTILLLSPPSQHASASAELVRVLPSLENEVRTAAAGLRGVSVITAGDVAGLYPVEVVDDPESDRQGHVPFTHPYWVAIGTMLIRNARTFLQPPHKVIAMDADNTLWGGVVGELGADHVQMEAGRLALQEFLRERKRQGMLLALVSKNKQSDVADVFQRADMVLRPEDFVAWKVNWEPKSENLRALAAELDLGLDSIVFLDDNPMECAEVGAHCPSVAVLCLPPHAEDIPSFLRHVWAFDLPPATSADKSRTEQYRQQSERNQFLSQAGSFRDFMESLDLRVELAPPRPDQFDRAAQLTQRTNQFNVTGVRRTAPELASVLTSGERQALLVRVRDRFGDYGEVGLCVYSARDGALQVENFLLSCRVLGKGVEYRMLAALGRIATELGQEHVVVPFTRTERNEPAAKFLEVVGGLSRHGDLYRFRAGEAAGVVFDPEHVNEPVLAGDDESAPPITRVAGGCDFGEIADKLANVQEIHAAFREQYFTSRPELGVRFASPRNRREQTLAEIWADVLGLDRVGIHDSFFDLGGDSILSIQVISKASQSGLRYTLRQHFESPTIAELASVLETADVAPSKAEQGAVMGTAPLTPIQRWLFEKELAEPHHWNMEVLLEAQHVLSPDILEQALSHVFAHHDALRLRFRCHETGWYQENDGRELTGVFRTYDLSTMSAEMQDIEMRRIAAIAHSSLSLENGPLLRASWFELGHSRAGRLLIVIHHLVVDGITWRVLLEDVQTAYGQLVHAQPVQLPRKSTSYLQWATRLDAYANGESALAERGYWINSSPTDIVPLPIDYPENRFAGTEDRARTATISLNQDETRSLLVEVPKAYQTQINDVLLTALLLTFYRWTGRSSLLIDLEGHGREGICPDLDVSRTAGWFTSIFPVRLRVEPPADLGGSLKFVKEQLRAIPNRGIGYGLLRYANSDASLRDSLRHLPAAEVMFNYLGQFDQVLPANGLFNWVGGNGSGALLHGPRGRRSHLLEIIGRVTGGRLHMEWTYSDSVFDSATVEQLARNFGDDLRALIRHCLATDAGGVTPSDFPLARLGQVSLDEVMTRLAKSRM